MYTFATLDELKDRFERELDEGEERIALGALEALSAWAVHYGSPSWDPEVPGSAPVLVKTLVIQAAARFLRNPDAYVTSRSGDETLSWSDLGEEGGMAKFTQREIDALKALTKGVSSVGVMHSGMFYKPAVRRRPWVYVPNDGHVGKSFPFYAYESSDFWGYEVRGIR